MNISIICFCLVYSVVLTAQSYKLTVLNGYGSGVFKAGDTVMVWSKAIPNDSVFNGWNQDVKVKCMITPREWTSGIIMPATDITITATFMYAEPLQWNEADVDVGFVKKHVWYSIPKNPIALITLHHFTNGRGKLWTERTEYTQFAHAARAMGFGLLAYNCDEVDSGPQDNDNKDQWKAFPVSVTQNPDHKATRALLDSLIARNLVTEQTPLFAVGMSVGGGYTLSVAMTLGYTAWANYCSGGPITIADSTTIPGIQAPAINDANADDAPIGENNKKAREVYEKLIGRGVRCEWMQNQPQPLYPQRFARISGVTIAKSTAMLNQLRDKGFLYPNDIPKIQSDTLEYVIKNYPAVLSEFSTLPETQWKEALYQYRVAFADHEFHSNFTYATLDFFKGYIQQTTSVLEYPKIEELQVLPNPAQEYLHVAHASLSEYSYTIYNSLGQMVHSGLYSYGHHTIGTSHLPNGLYYLNIVHGTLKTITPFIISR